MLCCAVFMLPAVIVWLTVSVLLDGPCVLVGHVLGLQLSPSMDTPLASTGLADFWGRRYNRAVSAVLRMTVYQPLLECLACSCSRQSQLAQDLQPKPAVGSNSSSNNSSSNTWSSNSGSGSSNIAPLVEAQCGMCTTTRDVQCGAQVQHHAADDSHPCHQQCQWQGRQCARKQCAQAVSTLVTFAVSGLMHEVCTW